MQSIFRIFTGAIAVIGIIAINSASSQNQKTDEWTGSLKDGSILTRNGLDQILTEHERWLSTNGTQGEAADLRGATLSEANLSGVNLNGANLSGANLHGANLREAFLQATNLTAILIEADLTGANLHIANLTGADLRDTDLTNAYLRGVNWASTIFEPDPESIVGGRAFIGARNLSKMRFIRTPDALVALREAFKKAGMREQEREVTFAIKSRQRARLWYLSWPNKIESIFNLFFIELTCAYGMYPGRPIGILLTFIFLFTVPYIIALRTWSPAGIWVTWKKREFKVQSRPSRFWVRLNRRLRWLPIKWLRDARVAFYFSLLSAFHIGWRDLNVGNWITRIQSREYTLRGTGWVRTVSGLQSLISVYLLALWALTYFGRPFE